MQTIHPRPKKAAKAAIDRLLQMRQLWEDAAESYFEPTRFMLSLQNCITTSRTVTFILQSNKADIPNFDKWYGSHVARWAIDPIMKWAKDARNSIEKQGDLQALSQVRAEIIAGYLPGPETKWMPQHLFSSPKAIWKNVPYKYQIPHIHENGTLLIERRWVDSNLPETEVLEALAHVYGEFCSTITDLLNVNGVAVPPQLDRTRPDPMGELAMDRAIYLSMADGSVRGHRFYKKPAPATTDADKKKLLKRYGANGTWKRLAEAKTFRDLAEAQFEKARAVMKRDGIHYTFVFLFQGTYPLQMIRADHSSRAARYVLMRDLARLARIADADGVMYLGETWLAQGEDVPPSGFAADAVNRSEAVVLCAANSAGETYQLTAEIERKRLGSLKVKRLGPTDTEETGFPFMFVPFQQLWNCLDEDAMQHAFDRMDEMGVVTPTLNEEPPPV